MLKFFDGPRPPKEVVSARLKEAREPKINRTPAKAFTPPAETKMGTRPDRAVTRAFIGGGVYSLISVLPN